VVAGIERLLQKRWNFVKTLSPLARFFLRRREIRWSSEVGDRAGDEIPIKKSS
jgi:hypothetical protein